MNLKKLLITGVIGAGLTGVLGGCVMTPDDTARLLFGTPTPQDKMVEIEREKLELSRINKDAKIKYILVNIDKNPKGIEGDEVGETELIDYLVSKGKEGKFPQKGYWVGRKEDIGYQGLFVIIMKRENNRLIFKKNNQNNPWFEYTIQN